MGRRRAGHSCKRGMMVDQNVSLCLRCLDGHLAFLVTPFGACSAVAARRLNRRFRLRQCVPFSAIHFISR